MKLKRFQQVRNTHAFSRDLHSRNPEYAREVFYYTQRALEDDVGNHGDITTRLLGIGDKNIEAKIVSKGKGIFAGGEEICFFLKQKGSGRISFRFLKKDGDFLQKNDVIALLKGQAKDILKVERTVLNLLQRMSGVATLTNQYVQKVSSPILITPTRKTLCGLLDKRACTVGGGGTHRLNLGDAILVKDTHMTLLDLENIFKKIFSHSLGRKKNWGRFVEIEVESYQQAIRAGKLFMDFPRIHRHFSVPFFLMFDNMKPGGIKKIIHFFREMGWDKNIFFEASGGITLKNVRAYSQTGVDVLSIGALTHSAPALDISLRIS